MGETINKILDDLEYYKWKAIFSSRLPGGSTRLCTATAKKKTKKKQRAGLGLEIPVMYQARWKHGKALKWLEKAIEKMLLQADEIASQFKSERFF